MQHHYQKLNRILSGLYKALAACLASCLLIYVVQNGSPSQYAQTVQKSPGQFMDFRVFRSFASLALSNERANLYNYDKQKQYFAGSYPESDLLASYVPYPPPFAILWAPLSLLAESWGFLAWSLLSLLVYAAGSFYLASSYQVRASVSFWILCAALSSLPSWRCIALGQCSLFASGIFAFFLAASHKRNALLSALSINLLLLKPQLAVLPATKLFCPELKKSLLISVFCFLMILIACFLFPGKEAVLSYPQALLSVSEHAPASFHTSDMSNLRGLLSCFGLNSALPSLLFFGASLTITVYALLKKQTSKNPALSLWIVFASLAFGIHVHFYECTALVIPAILLLGNSPEQVYAPQCRIALAIIKTMLLLYPPVSWILYLAFYGKSSFFFAAFALINLLLAFASIDLLLQSRARDASQPEGAN